jgi:hypothetical protein
MVSEGLTRGGEANTISGLSAERGFNVTIARRRRGGIRRPRAQWILLLGIQRRYARHNFDEDLNSSSESTHYGAVSFPNFNLLKSSERLVLMLTISDWRTPCGRQFWPRPPP